MYVCVFASACVCVCMYVFACVCVGGFVFYLCGRMWAFFLCQACHVSLLFQIKIENPPLLFCLLISRFLSSVSIKPMTTMLVILCFCGVCVGGGVWVCGVFSGVCVCGCGMLICFVSALGSHEMGRHKLSIIIITWWEERRFRE